MSKPFDNIKENICHYCEKDGEQYKCTALVILNKYIKMEESQATGDDCCTQLQASVCKAIVKFRVVENIIEMQEQQETKGKRSISFWERITKRY